ncbi:MAG: GNAT family N-acetyltransferase [Desulfobacteraceae bacterium]|nr:GNAT family N-acetyltransferase [Desulfobacteraceae bacterium]
MTVSITSPRDPMDLERMFQFLYEVWNNEYDRDIPGMDHHKRWVRDDLDDWADHLIALSDTGQILGCVRINRLNRGIPSPQLSGNMAFEKLGNLFGRDKVSFLSHLAVAPSHRGSTVVSLLMSHVFRVNFEKRIEVATCYCQLNLVSLYARFGLCPYLANFRVDAGVRVPMIGCVNDRDYLEKTGSPLAKLMLETLNDNGRAAKRLEAHFPRFYDPGLEKIPSKALWAQLAHAPALEEQQDRFKLFQDIPQKSVEQALKLLPRLQLVQGEVLFMKGDREVSMGIVLSGSMGLGVGDGKDPHFISVIRPGEPFGEINILTKIKHSTTLIALERSKVMLLSDQMFERIAKKDSGLAVHLYKNVVNILARRMTDANNNLSEILGKNGQGSIRVRRPALYGPAQPVESYSFDTLMDKESEFKRLKLQAKVAEAMELSKLKSIGLGDGDTILDLGSGPGVTAMLLSRHFPQSRIIGIEPDKNLRTRSEAMKAEKNLNHCVFLEGTAREIPLEDDAVDFSYARLLFQHIPDPMAALKEMHRVTRKNGIACILDVDDDTIFLHPRVRAWEAVENRVAIAQSSFGGDRHVGRKLLAYLLEAGFESVRVDLVPVTTQMLGPKVFFDIVFGFKKQILMRAGDWDEETGRLFDSIRDLLLEKGSFASENIFVVHGTAT